MQACSDLDSVLHCKIGLNGGFERLCFGSCGCFHKPVKLALAFVFDNDAACRIGHLRQCTTLQSAQGRSAAAAAWPNEAGQPRVAEGFLLLPSVAAPSSPQIKQIKPRLTLRFVIKRPPRKKKNQRFIQKLLNQYGFSAFCLLLIS